MSTFIDHVRCGECDAGLTLDRISVVLQRYRRQPWLRHFWVHCDVCATHKLYWPTARQMRLADQLRCRTVTDDLAAGDIVGAYARAGGLPVAGQRAPIDIRNREIGFLLSMLAATSRAASSSAPATSYLPAHWAN